MRASEPEHRPQARQVSGVVGGIALVGGPVNGRAQSSAASRGADIPRALQIGMIAMVLFAIAAAAFGKITDIGTVRNEQSRPIAIRDITFSERAGDVLDVIDARDGATLLAIAPEKEGFVRGALRGLMRQRLVMNAQRDAPFRVISWEDGRVTLSDTATGQTLTLNAFGATNLAAFARFLDPGIGK